MATLDVLGLGKALGTPAWLPFTAFSDSERMAEAALAAKTLVAEVRGVVVGAARGNAARRMRAGGRRPGSSAGVPRRWLARRADCARRAPPCVPQNRLKEATEATRIAAEARPAARATPRGAGRMP